MEKPHKYGFGWTDMDMSVLKICPAKTYLSRTDSCHTRTGTGTIRVSYCELKLCSGDTSSANKYRDLGCVMRIYQKMQGNFIDTEFPRLT